MLMSLAVKRLSSVVGALVIAVFALAACGTSAASSGGSGQAVNVNVTLSDFKIESSLTTFSTGVHYHFIVANHGSVAHQALIMPPEPGTISADQATKMSVAGIGGSGINPGTTQSFDYIFTKAYPAGQLEFACHLPGHYDAGMHLSIVVK
jgi:uncharacterized cupredoxin-like copper-binding protein